MLRVVLGPSLSYLPMTVSEVVQVAMLRVVLDRAYLASGAKSMWGVLGVVRMLEGVL